MDRLAAKLDKTYRILLLELGPQGWWPLSWRSGESGFDPDGYHPGLPRLKLTARDRFEISIGAILTQNTAWKNVEIALGLMRRSGLTSPERLLSAPEASLKEAIRSCGYYNQKAKKLRFACERFVADKILKSESAPEREALLDIWGIGPETADSILLYAFNAPIFVIDAYTKRVFSRLGAIDPRTDYPGFQQAFMSRLPLDPRLFNEYHALIVKFCKIHCSAKPNCGECPLKRGCAAGKHAAKG